MTEQASLFPVSSGSVCCHGQPLLSPCAECKAIADELDAGFEADVRAGKYNHLGYTLKEWLNAGLSKETWQSGEKKGNAA